MKKTLTIGIAAHNEASTIGKLITSLLEQKINLLTLEKIVVVSDASTDGTDAIVTSLNAPVVHLVRLDSRRGLNSVQNILMQETTSDYLILLDADILPCDVSFINNLMTPLLHNTNVGLTSARLIPLQPRSFVEKVLSEHHMWKEKLFQSISGGNNIYTCFGPARAFSRALYEKMKYPDNVPVDAYSYLYCLQNKFTFIYALNAAVCFRCPSTIADHIKQSRRFMSGQKSLMERFGISAKDAYTLPLSITTGSMLRQFLTHPIVSIAYLIIQGFVFTRKQSKFYTSRWEVSSTSKTNVTI